LSEDTTHGTDIGGRTGPTFLEVFSSFHIEARFPQVPEVIRGVKFVDGIKEIAA
jgi:hypothetical protein